MSHRRASLLLLILITPALGQPITAPPSQPPAQPPAPATRAVQPPPPRRGTAILPQGVKAIRDIEYANVDGHALRLDLYVPEPPAMQTDVPTPQPSRSKLPTVIWVHGGGWSAGNKNLCPAVAFVPSGFAVVSINYRLTGAAPFPAQIHDCKGAVRWVRAHAAEYGLDPDRIGAWGASAGGHLVALLGTSAGDKDLEGTVGGNLDQSSAIQAVCDWFGPTDLIKLAHADAPRDAGENADTQPPADSARGLLARLFGGPVRDHLDLAKKANPITFITKNDPPFLIMHGDQDALVPISQSELLTEALKAAGVQVQMHTVKDAGHGFRGPDEVKMVGEFFRDKLAAPPRSAKPTP